MSILRTTPCGCDNSFQRASKPPLPVDKGEKKKVPLLFILLLAYLFSFDIFLSFFSFLLFGNKFSFPPLSEFIELVAWSHFMQVIGYVEKVSTIRNCSSISATSGIFAAKISGTFKRYCPIISLETRKMNFMVIFT